LSRPEVTALVERGNVTAEEILALSCTYSEWVELIPAMTDEAFAARVEQALRNPQGEPFQAVYAPELLRRFKGTARAARVYAESLDNVREALGQEQTHYLVIADDVEELVKAVELCASDGGCRAMTVLTKLRMRDL
jgi:hypothetical protein